MLMEVLWNIGLVESIREVIIQFVYVTRQSKVIIWRHVSVVHSHIYVATCYFFDFCEPNTVSIKRRIKQIGSIYHVEYTYWPELPV